MNSQSVLTGARCIGWTVPHARAPRARDNTQREDRGHGGWEAYSYPNYYVAKLLFYLSTFIYKLSRFLIR